GGQPPLPEACRRLARSERSESRRNMSDRGSRMTFLVFGLAVLMAFVASTPNLAQQPAAPRPPDVVFVPTPADVVDAMLKLAKVTSSDVVYDLGSGDVRILIAAAKTYGARGVGIDIDPERVREATANARSTGVCDKVTFRAEVLFTADIS